MMLCLTKIYIALEYTSRPYPESLATQIVVLYITYATSSHEQTGNILTFAQFGERNLSENEWNLVEYESILAPIEGSYAENKSNHESISTESIEDIQYGKYVHLYINSIYTILKIRKHIRQ